MVALKPTAVCKYQTIKRKLNYFLANIQISPYFTVAAKIQADINNKLTHFNIIVFHLIK